MRWWQAVLWGPVFPVLLHAVALRHGRPRQRRWIAAELVSNGLLLGVAVVLPLGALRYHVGAMLTAHCLTAFFAVWTVHHDCDPDRELARTLRHPFKSAIAFDMFFHVEHHLFPKVPTRHLPELARRLDRAAPDLTRKPVY
jgi:fatty acid desaturase